MRTECQCISHVVMIWIQTYDHRDYNSLNIKHVKHLMMDTSPILCVIGPILYLFPSLPGWLHLCCSRSPDVFMGWGERGGAIHFSAGINILATITIPLICSIHVTLNHVRFLYHYDRTYLCF